MERRSLRDQMNSTSELLARLKSDRSIGDVSHASLDSVDDRAHVRPVTHAAPTPSRTRTYSLSSQQSSNRNSFYLARDAAPMPPAPQSAQGHPQGPLELTYQRDAERQLLGAVQAAKHDMPGDLVVVLLQRVVAQTIALYDGVDAGDIDALCVLLCDMLRAYQDDKAPRDEATRATAHTPAHTPAHAAHGTRSPDLRNDPRGDSRDFSRSSSRLQRTNSRTHTRVHSNSHDELLSPLRTRESSRADLTSPPRDTRRDSLWEPLREPLRDPMRDANPPRVPSRLASSSQGHTSQGHTSPLLPSPPPQPAVPAHAAAPAHAPRTSSIPDASAKATRLKAVIDRLQRRPSERS